MAENESDYSWELAGYLEAGEEFNDGYHNFDPASDGARIEVESFDGNWDFIGDADYVVLHVTDNESGDDFYVTIAGPFDDYEDFLEAYHDWEEEGS